MEKKPETKKQVLILSVTWDSDSKHIGEIVTLKEDETHTRWATGVLSNGRTVVIKQYAPATELNKALI